MRYASINFRNKKNSHRLPLKNFNQNYLKNRICPKSLMLLQCVYSLKSRSHGAIFLFATAMQKMECVDVNGGVQMVRFHVWCVRHRTWLGCTPILCNCDVRFQCKYIANRIHTHRTVWTKSLKPKQHPISWCNKSQSHIVPCERALNPV